MFKYNAFILKCVVLNPCSTLVLFNYLMHISFAEIIGSYIQMYLMMIVALLGFQYVFTMQCLMLMIEQMLDISWCSVILNLRVPLNWISSTKNLPPSLTKYWNFLLEWVVGLNCVFYWKCCMFLTFFIRSNHFSPWLLFCCLSFRGVTCQTLFYVCCGCEYIAVATSPPPFSLIALCPLCVTAKALPPLIKNNVTHILI